MQKLTIDRLHLVALCVTILAAIMMYTGVFLPHWWVLKHRMGKVNATFGLFGDIQCDDSACFPLGKLPAPRVVAEPADTPVSKNTTASPEPTGTVTSDSFAGNNAGWILAGRVLSIISLALVSVSLILQAIFFKLNYKKVQVVAISLLILAGLVSFITGFLFIDKYSALTKVYVFERPIWSLTYTPAAAGCILIGSLLCVVACVFISFAFRPPDKNRLL